jgi:ketosteroid isomerase-like protein
VLGYFGRLAELTEGTYRVELHDVLGNDEHVVTMHRASAQRHGRTLADAAVHVCHVADGQITEVWTMFGDQYLVDQFWTLD